MKIKIHWIWMFWICPENDSDMAILHHIKWKYLRIDDAFLDDSENSQLELSLTDLEVIQEVDIPNSKQK